jgi:hypothetical protein
MRSCRMAMVVLAVMIDDAITNGNGCIGGS